jgi:DNA-binding NtrC family response regulator
MTSPRPPGHVVDETAALAADADPPPTPGDYLLCIEGDRSFTVPLPGSGELVVGRDPQANLVLADAQVSRTHAQLLRLPDGLRLTDLGSRHGTTVNGEPLAGPRHLVSGDVVGVGGALLIVRSRAVAPARPTLERSEWTRRLADEAGRARQFQRELTVLVARLVQGDLPRLAAGLRPRLRASDAMAALDERSFGLLLPELGGDEAGELAAELHALAHGQAARLSLGLAVCPDDGVDANTLLGAARDAAGAATAGQTAVARQAGAVLDLGARRALVADPAMQQLFELARRLARSSLPVLVQGETGVGKEVAAAALHAWSPRAAGPFVSINCAAIPEPLAEAELFGHARGAFSGAHAARVGQLEAASGGTLFLDELGELPLPIQAKLLRVLETGELTRLGEVASRPVDLRLVAATHRDLEAEIEAGRFRRDLYFRLGAARVVLPPLRDRPRDLGPLVADLLAAACARLGRPSLRPSVAAMHALRAHDWPGNVRELRNAVEYAAAAAPDEARELEVWHLPDALARAAREREAGAPLGEPAAAAAPVASSAPRRAAADVPSDRPRFRPIADEVRELERARMVAALCAAGGVHNRAAELIEMPLRTFATKLKRYAILPRDWSDP